MGAKEKKRVFQTELFKIIIFLNHEYIKCITDHFFPCVLFYSCIYIVPNSCWNPNRRHSPTARTYCLPILLHLYWKYLATLWETWKRYFSYLPRYWRIISNRTKIVKPAIFDLCIFHALRSLSVTSRKFIHRIPLCRLLKQGSPIVVETSVQWSCI